MNQLSEKEAYAAMFAFLEDRYEVTKSDDLGGLLGSMSFLPSGKTADPAIWEDWCKAVSKAKAGNVMMDLDLK